MTSPRRAAASLVCLVLLSPGISACSGQSAVCDDLDSINASIQNLKDAKLGENGLTVVRTELSKIGSDLKQLRADASAQYASQIDAVEARARALRPSITAAAADPSAESLAQVRAGLRAFGSAVGDLSDAVSGSC